MKKTLLLLAAFALILTSCTKESGTINLSYNKATAQYGDLDQVRQTPLIASVRTIENAGKVFVGEQVLLIGEENKGIHVFDNTNPSNPTNILFMDLPFTKEFFVEGDHIYAESHYDLVKINIADMNAPYVADRLEFAFADALTDGQGRTLIGFDVEQVNESFEIGSPELSALQDQGKLYFNYQQELIPFSAVPASFAGNGNSIGTINRVAYDQGHVYVIGSSKLHTFNDQGASMYKSSEQHVSMGAETIYPDAQHLFIGTRTSVEIYRTIDPDQPDFAGHLEHAESCDPVLPNGNVAYSTLRTGDATFCPGDVNALLVLDITDKTNPILIEEIEMNSPYGMTIHNDLLYVGEGGNGLRVFDVSDSDAPQELASDWGTKAYDIMVHPTIANLLLTTGPNGVDQYQQDPSTLDLTLLSSIGF